MNNQNLNSILNKRFQSALLVLFGFFLVLAFVPVKTANAISISPPRLELAGDPGTTISSEIKVTNDSEQPQTYFTQVENFEAADESGNPSFVPTQENLATWVKAPASITLDAKEETTLSFDIRIPASAEPGGYFASLFIRTTPPPAQGGEVSIGARVGSLILLRVNGDIAEGVDILEFSTQANKKFYTSLPVSMYYRFQNTGADRVKPEGTIAVKNIIGMNAKILSANRTEGSVLPRSIRRFEADWVNGGGGEEDIDVRVGDPVELGFFEAARAQLSNFAFGYYTANLDISFGENNNTAQEKFSFFVFPWQLLVLVIGGLLVIFLFLKIALKLYTKRIIAKHAK